MIYNLKIKPMEIPPAELRKNDKFFILCELFIRKGTQDNWDTKDWMREKFAAKKLVSKYNDFDFFYSLNNLQGKFNSLLGLMSKKYHNLDTIWENFVIEKQKNKKYPLEEKPVVVIDEPIKKFRNVIEFLDN